MTYTEKARLTITDVKALLAEEALVRMFVSEELRELGWTITEVATADEGIAIVEAGERFNLVVTDINMPGATDGLDLARLVSSTDPSAKIAIMSGRPSRDAAEELCDLYLDKPCWDLAAKFTELLNI